MSLSEKDKNEVHEIFEKGWKFLNRILEKYPEFPQQPLTEEEWDNIINIQAGCYEKGQEYYKDDEASFFLYRSMLVNAVIFLEKKGGER